MGILSLSTHERSRRVASRAALAVVCVGVTLLWAACSGDEGGPGRYAARGVVEEVDLEGGQVLIDHGDVEGLMPGMTMNFAVRDPALLEKLAPGQIVEFEIHFTGRSYDVTAARVVGEATVEQGWLPLRDGLVRSSPAPPFELIDQAGRSVSLASLGDRVLLVDFIYTSCPGPCPVQTSNQVALQKSIPDSLRDAVHFVSISLDPAVDRPEVLKRYALERGADLSSWSFLTGPVEEVADVVRRWGVGSLRKEDGTIDHTLWTFLVKEGQILERYSPRDAGDEKILAGVIDLARRRAESSDRP